MCKLWKCSAKTDSEWQLEVKGWSSHESWCIYIYYITRWHEFVAIVHKWFCVSFYTVPPPSVMLKILGTQTVGQSLSMECTITTVKGLSSSIDVTWRIDGVETKEMLRASISSSTSSSIIYRDLYNISLLTTAEEGRIYQCEGVINTSSSLNAESSITLDIIGM